MEFEKVIESMLCFFFGTFYLIVFFFVYSFLIFRLCSKQDDFQEQYTSESNISNIHQKEELDAAEALTFLAGNLKSQWVK